MSTRKTVPSLAVLAVRALLVLPCGACFAPPALLRSQPLPNETIVALYPPQSQFLSLEDVGREPLRGVFVPAEEGAPVVLHLLDSSGSFGGIGTDLAVVAHQLRDMGLASLFFDYTGVGLSPGERSIENLLPDAERAWREALRRAGGDPGRIVIRAISLGTIAAAELVASGARPRLVVALAPVLPDTVVPRFAREFHGWPAWIFASVVFRPVTRLDPCEVIASSGVPWHVIGSEDDPLLSPEEVERIKAAVVQSGGSWHENGGDHLFLGMSARQVGSDELPLLRELASSCPPAIVERAWAEMPEELRARFTDGSEERARLEELARTQRGASALELAAAALANEDWIASWRMLWLTRIHPYPPLDFDDRVASLSLRSPGAGVDLPVWFVEFLSLGHDLAWRYERSWQQLAPSVIWAFVENGGRDANGNVYTVAYQLHCGLTFTLRYDLEATRIGLVAQQPTPWEANLALARMLLKSLRIPDRVQVRPDSSFELEAFWQGKWQRVPAASSPAAMTVTAGCTESKRPTSPR